MAQKSFTEIHFLLFFQEAKDGIAAVGCLY